MKNRSYDDRCRMILCLAASCFLGIIFILLVFSPGNIIPTNVNWVINGGGDNLQHYLGWRFFRNSPWTRYILFMKNWDYPVGTSVIVTDSNPLFCLIFKLLDKILPDVFQFNGLWILTSYVLLAFFAGLIGWRLTKNILLTLAGTVFVILNPVILQRALIHDTLTAHWLILASIWLFINDDKKWNCPGWFILIELSLLIHVYFVPMLAFVFSLQVIRMLQKKRSALRVGSTVVVFLTAVLFGYFVFGYSYILPQSGSYGELSMNLNAFFNPDGVSSILPSRPTLPLQYEGFNYFGLGLLILIPLAILRGIRNFRKQWLLYLGPALILILIAVSDHAYFDLHQVFHITLSERFVSMLTVLRSSGRLVWPFFYLVLFGSLRLLSSVSDRKKVIYFAVLVCLAIQIVDLTDFCFDCSVRFRSPENHLTDLPSELSDFISEKISHLYISDGDAKSVDALALFAADRKMTINTSTNARSIKHIFGGDKLDMEHLICGQVTADSVYLYLSHDYPAVLNECDYVDLVNIDEWTLIRNHE